MATKKENINNKNQQNNKEHQNQKTAKLSDSQKKDLNKELENCQNQLKKLSEENEKLQQELSKLNDNYLRLAADFDNYKKRTLKEKMELVKTAGEDIFTDLLPVIDNFERALEALEQTDDINAVKEGIFHIYKGFKDFLENHNVQEIEALEKQLDTDLHEAVAQEPAPKPELKGKIIKVIQKGYKYNDKVIRHAKVVVGS